MEDPNLPSFPVFEIDKLVGVLDAAHAAHLKTKRSVTECMIFFALASIVWKSCMQPLAAISSIEAEICAAMTCPKVAKCI